MFIDLSSDYIHLIHDTQSLSLPRNGIENVLWPELIKRHKAYPFTQVHILNWPGGFTNLRVGSLCLNLLNTLLDNQLDFFSVSKTDLYQFAYDQGDLPRFGVIYIGQKHNIRLRDFQERKKIWQLTFDELKSNANTDPLFLDITTDTNYYPDFLSPFSMLTYPQIQSRFIAYLEKTAQAPTKSIEANYMIDPIITPPRCGC